MGPSAFNRTDAFNMMADCSRLRSHLSSRSANTVPLGKRNTEFSRFEMIAKRNGTAGLGGRIQKKHKAGSDNNNSDHNNNNNN